MINKKNKLLFICTGICLFICISSFAQVTITRQVLATTGSSKTIYLGTDSVTFDYTVGDFMVTTTDTLNAIHLTQGFQQPSDTIIFIKNLNVKLHIYRGITPNGDGHNDKWEIDGITDVSDNKVSIFNRWGDLVWSKKNYDNVTVVWEGKNNKGNPLTDATYFYIIEAGGETYKGWVELTH